MMWTLLIGLAQARDGTSIGVLGPLPQEPASVKPSHTRAEGAELALSADPKVLIPVGYDSSHGNMWERYYDESGEVWRYREVESILAMHSGSAEYIAQAKRKRKIGYSLGIAGALLFPDTLGCCFSEGAMSYAYRESEQSLRSALTTYNLRDQMPAELAAEPAPEPVPESEAP